METAFEKIARKRKERDRLFKLLERRISRLANSTETKNIISESSERTIQNNLSGLEVLGAAKPDSAQLELANMAVSGRKGRGQNARRRRMGS